jgi:hypothetical protein
MLNFQAGQRRRLTAPIRNNTPRFPRLTGTKPPDFRTNLQRARQCVTLKVESEETAILQPDPTFASQL